MINCAHGKDRTGIVTALVLWCVGWSKDDIVADYAQSQVLADRVYGDLFNKGNKGSIHNKYMFCAWLNLLIVWLNPSIAECFTQPMQPEFSSL